MSQTEDEEIEETRGEEEIQLITLFVSVCVCITHKGMESYIYIYVCLLQTCSQASLICQLQDLICMMELDVPF